MRVTWLVVGLGVLLSGCGQCTAACLTEFTVVLTGASGQRLAPLSASVTRSTVATRDVFDCRPADGGVGTRGCGVDRITFITLANDEVINLSVTAASGESFVGDVTVTTTKNGYQVCGSDCRSGSTTITLE